MAKAFKSLTAFAKHLQNNVIPKYERREHDVLTVIGLFLEKDSKSIIGHLQHGLGGAGYGAWEPLAEATQREKERLGYGSASNDWQPLLRTGELRDSISYSVQLHQVHIGSDSEIMVWQELGTMRIPPRPVLGLAMYRNKVKLEKALCNFVVSWITDTRAKGKIE